MISFKAFLIIEASVFSTVYATFVTLRKSESTRRKAYENVPSLAKFYYSTEDFISHGQLVGTRIKHRDINRWYGDILTSSVPESD
uniref:Secreted protein n=1 Tax=Strongyloides papillosus TaxID=174720 RepID=A0A0N5B9B9_STREA